MGSILKKIWIFSKEGIPIAGFGNDNLVDKTLMGGFISAIKSFSKELTDEGLKSFKMKEFLFTLKPVLQGNVILVCKTNSSIKNKKIQKLCDIVRQIFENLYGLDDLKSWDGDLSFFDSFNDKLNLYFKISNL